MLFISHDLAVVSQVADRVAVMRHGLLLEQASRAAIFRDPLHEYTRSLLGAVPTMRTDLDQPLAMVGPSGVGSSGEVHPLREAAPGHWARV
jgi:peptide/nickel transport system ATP-binding protein